MSKITEIFSFQRFMRVFVNDLILLQARRIAFASLGLIGIGVIIYASNASNVPAANMELGVGTFGALLFGIGHIFTSMIYNDMHHPLERFHYLLLPYSNLERFISRYLITAPLFLVFAIVLHKVIEIVANFVIVSLLEGTAIPLRDIGSEESRRIMLGYFISHVFVYCGAIWFRSYSLIKTVTTSTLFWVVCAVVMFLTIRILYWNSFISFFEINPEGPFPDIIFDPFNDDETLKGWVKAGLIALVGWFLFLAYLGLEEHEVQDGL